MGEAAHLKLEFRSIMPVPAEKTRGGPRTLSDLSVIYAVAAVPLGRTARVHALVAKLDGVTGCGFGGPG